MGRSNVRCIQLAALVVLACIGSGFAARFSRSPPPDRPAVGAARSATLVEAAVHDAPVADNRTTGPPAVVEPPGVSSRVARLWTEGSLRGSALDGDWGVWVGDRLQPGMGLRQRFDQLLSTQGEVGVGDLRVWIGGQVTASHGASGAAQVLAVWDHYLKVQLASYGVEINPYDPGTWQRALAEHSRVRRQILGSAWAEAFYGQEERDLAADAARRLTTSTAEPSYPGATADSLLISVAPSGNADEANRLQSARAAQFGADAASRLQASDAAWGAWQQRIASARTQWQALEEAPELSPVQRQEAKERLLVQQFEGSELTRARGLLAPTPVGK